MVVLDPQPDWLEQRRRTGADRWDEVWDGVAHVPPMPTTSHQRFESLREKLPFYAQCGVKEVWIVDGLRLRISWSGGSDEI